MRKRANVFLAASALAALQALCAIASFANDGADPEERAGRRGDDRWVPSFAITGGATIEEQSGNVDSSLFEDGSPTPVPLRPSADANDLAASPFVGGSLELMAPALPIPTRPRLFVSGEILPTFASDRDLALEGDPGCVHGPEPADMDTCARDEDGTRVRPYGEGSALGVGSRTTATVDTLVFGASMGIAFPLQLAGRELRIKPSVGWINYKVKGEGIIVAAACNPVTICTDYTLTQGGISVIVPGFLRETTLEASDSRRYNGIGPGLDVEMDAGRFGPLGVALFLGARAYRILDDDPIVFGATESFNDVLGNDVAEGNFKVEVDPWMYRAHVGIRFQWLGSRE